MKPMWRKLQVFLLAGMVLLWAQGGLRAEDEAFDAVSDNLKFNAFDGNVRGHLTGLLDVEGYYFNQLAPAFIESNRDFLFNPRLTLFLDGQLGPKLYFFVQTRVDRGFDPADAHAQIRLDEYAFRFTPWNDGRVNVQVGKFATVLGTWANRHDSWENPFITAPLPYENLTSMWDSYAVDSAATLLSWTNSEKNVRLPLIWGPAYATGVAVSGRVGKFDYAAEIKNTALSARPDAWNISEIGMDHPSFSGRIGWRPDEAWNAGVSASAGEYLLPMAADALPPGRMFGDYRQVLLGQDISYAWHHWQFWAEFFENRFEIPGVGNANSFAYYLEAKYKITPQLFGALRWNQQVYNDFPDGAGGSVPWSYNSWRIDTALTWRFTPHIQAKLQYSFLRQDRAERENQNLLALQFTIRF